MTSWKLLEQKASTASRSFTPAVGPLRSATGPAKEQRKQVAWQSCFAELLTACNIRHAFVIQLIITIAETWNAVQAAWHSISQAEAVNPCKSLMAESCRKVMCKGGPTLRWTAAPKPFWTWQIREVHERTRIKCYAGSIGQGSHSTNRRSGGATPSRTSAVGHPATSQSLRLWSIPHTLGHH